MASINTGFPTATIADAVRRAGGHLDQHPEHHQSDARAGRAVRRQFPAESNEFLLQRRSEPYLLRLRFLPRPDGFRVRSASTPIWATDGDSTTRLTPRATGTNRTTRTAPRSTSPRQAQRRGQAERIPPCRRHRDSQQGIQVGHLPHRHLVRLGLHGPLPDSVQHPDRAGYAASATSTNISSRRPSSRSPSTNGIRLRNW